MATLNKWNSLSEAAEWLSETTAEEWSAKNVLNLICDWSLAGLPRQEGIAYAEGTPMGYAVAPEGSFENAKSMTPGFEDGLHCNDTFPLTWLQANDLLKRGSSKITYADFGNCKYKTNFQISINDVCVLGVDLEQYAESQKTTSTENAPDALSATQSTVEPTTNFAQLADEPPMKRGEKNSRSACFAWIQYMAQTMLKKGESLKTLNQRIADDANGPLRRYLMAGGKPFSIHIIDSALKPSAMGNKGKPGITGGTKANPGAGRTKFCQK